jgi:PhnB protein
MAVKYKPEGHHTITSYLVVKDAAGLIEFIKQAFDGVELSRTELPDGQIMHAEVRIGDSPLMIGGSNEKFPPFPGMLHLYIEDSDAFYRRALQAGAISLREPEDQFYGDRISGVADPFGNQWWLATHIEDVSPEEMQRRMEAMGQQS